MQLEFAYLRQRDRQIDKSNKSVRKSPMGTLGSLHNNMQGLVVQIRDLQFMICGHVYRAINYNTCLKKTSNITSLYAVC